MNSLIKLTMGSRLMPKTLVCALALMASLALAWPAGAANSPPPPLTGAIFTTISDGSEVNFNIYPDKCGKVSEGLKGVWLDGGPGPGAPQKAAGLPDGTYVFMVTDPSGKTLLSTDEAGCRQFTVADGIITGVVSFVDGGAECSHRTDTDIDHNATTVELCPFLDTPNPGGEYKVWVTRQQDYQCDLKVVDCGIKRGKKKDASFVHGFVPALSKTDNFKVRETGALEIDTTFNSDGVLLDGLGVTWTDTLGASNKKWSYYDPSINVWHEAHVETVEVGTHYIDIQNQPGCYVHDIYVAYDGSPTKYVGYGPQTVAISISPNFTGPSVFVRVYCGDTP